MFFAGSGSRFQKLLVAGWDDFCKFLLLEDFTGDSAPVGKAKVDKLGRRSGSEPQRFADVTAPNSYRRVAGRARLGYSQTYFSTV